MNRGDACTVATDAQCEREAHAAAGFFCFSPRKGTIRKRTETLVEGRGEKQLSGEKSRKKNGTNPGRSEWRIAGEPAKLPRRTTWQPQKKGRIEEEIHKCAFTVTRKRGETRRSTNNQRYCGMSVNRDRQLECRGEDRDAPRGGESQETEREGKKKLEKTGKKRRRRNRRRKTTQMQHKPARQARTKSI